MAKSRPDAAASRKAHPEIAAIERPSPAGTNAPGSARTGWLLVSVPLVATVFTLVTFPYLWPAPKTRIIFLFQYRASEGVKGVSYGNGVQLSLSYSNRL